VGASAVSSGAELATSAAGAGEVTLSGGREEVKTPGWSPAPTRSARKMRLTYKPNS